ncbi:hypothetical protein [Salaquimonas pukyongi]|uniref:hypothetical protein n=1 Tax=Salaquimonas pukyongi TaxID=2712698 RepID=UPI0019673BEA|nr:hypothetical protein [Salaquimonas pukyongi]
MNQNVSNGINAASSLYHFREHLPEDLRISRSELALICTDYDLLGYVVDAAKHGKIDRRSPPIDRANQIYPLIEITEYRDEAGPYRIARKRVVVELNDGTQRTLRSILTNVINMWIVFLAKNYVVDGIEQFELEDANFVPPRENDSEAARFDFSVHPSIGVAIRCQLKRFNYELGKPEPVDLTQESS